MNHFHMNRPISKLFAMHSRRPATHTERYAPHTLLADESFKELSTASPVQKML